MTPARTAPLALVLTLALACLLAGALPVAHAGAEGLADDGNASWRLEQPPPPPPPPGVQPSSVPIGLGRIGDIEFWAPNRGLLITAGNGSTVPPGLWAYNGEAWHELSTVCGATDGRIAWAGPDEFWTISDGRPGQAADPATGAPAPLEDDTLCHFAGGQVVGSYASLAFQATLYQPLHAGGCIGPSDCWFAGDPLLEPQVGAFQLHFNGHTVSAEPHPQGHAVEDMRLFGGRLYESLRLSAGDRLTDPEPSPPPVLRRVNPPGVQPTFVALSPGVPEYGPTGFPEALDFLRLGADAQALWGATGPASAAAELEGAEVTVVRYAGGVWSEVLGNPESSPAPPPNPFAGDVVSSIAAEPGGDGAWLALDARGDASHPSPAARALVARIAADGTVSDRQELPLPPEGPGGAEATGPRGAAEKVACPAPHDCWLATSQGWLYHLTDGAAPTPDTDPAFAGPITYRPPDEGVPQVVPDAPPVDDSGLVEEPPSIKSEGSGSTPEPAATLRAPLLSHVHTRIVRRTTLELRFHLAVKARVRLLAKRRRQVVARTGMSTLAAGDRRLLLRLDPRRWPTKLDLETHALAPLPVVSTRGAGNDSVTTESLAFPNALGLPRSDALL